MPNGYYSSVSVKDNSKPTFLVLDIKDANNHIETIKAKFKKKSFINPNTGEVDQKSNALCITLDTKIDLLDGRSETLSTLIEEYLPSNLVFLYKMSHYIGNLLYFLYHSIGNFLNILYYSIGNH